MEKKENDSELKIAAGYLNKNFMKILPFFALLGIMGAFVFLSLVRSGNFSEYFLPVGEGDSELIVAENGAKMLIDGGPANSSVLESLDKIIPPPGKYIDLVFMTHAQADHLGGLLDVMKNYRVGLFLWNGVKNDTETFKSLENALRADNVPSLILAGGDRVHAGGATVKVVSPESASSASVDINDSALVMEIDSGSVRSVFMSDVSSRAEEKIRKRISGAVSILKVAHHGSSGSSSERFLEGILPAVAVIEVGKNGYGHPAPRVIDRLRAVGARVFRTDEDGIIKISESDGGNIGVFAMR